jgi:hypothetical protein
MRRLLPALLACLLLQPLRGEGPRREVRVHDLRFLTRPVPDLPAGEWPRAGDLVLGGRGPVEYSAPISFASDVAYEEDPSHLAPPGAGLPPETIAAIIRQNVAEDSWASKLNSMDVHGSDLVVVQTREVQEDIEKLLAALRARRARMVTVDVAHVPLEALGGGWSPRDPWLQEELDLVLERAGEKAVRISLTAYNEQRLAGFTGRRTARVTDAEVNQTGVLPVTNPVVESLPLGLTVEVLPLAVAETGWFRVEMKVSRLREAGEAVKRETFTGDLEFLPLDEESIETVLLLPAGRTGVAGLLREEREGREPRGFAVLARVRPTDVQAAGRSPPPIGETFSLRVHDVGFLLEPYPFESPPLTADLLSRLIGANVDPDAWRDDRARLAADQGGRLLAVTAKAPTHERVKEYIDGLVRERATTAMVDLREIEGPSEEILAIRKAAEGGMLLPRDWVPPAEGGRIREAFRAVLGGALGCRRSARGYEARGFVGDISTVSGGTGFSIVAMPDPELESAGSGTWAEATVRATHGGVRFALDLTADRCRTLFARTAETIVPADIGPVQATPGAEATKEKKKNKKGDETARPLPSTVWIPAVLDLPSQRRLHSESAISVPPDRPAIVEVEDMGAGRARMVVATVTTLRAFGEGR